MTREELYKLIENGPVYLDGATGSNLMKAGMPVGVCPEEWITEHPNVILNLQKRYIEAGTQILYAPTFSGNRIKLTEYGLEDRMVEINTTLVRLCREAAGDKGLVCGNITMTGQSLAPMGTMKLETLIDIYKEQVKILCEAGVDLFVVETMMSLAETRAAILAIRETCDLPIMASMSFNEDGRTLYGTDPETAIVVLQSIGADVVGVNCSTGPQEMAEIIRKMKYMQTFRFWQNRMQVCRKSWMEIRYTIWDRRNLHPLDRSLWKQVPQFLVDVVVPHRSILHFW